MSGKWCGLVKLRELQVNIRQSYICRPCEPCDNSARIEKMDWIP